MAPLGIPLEKRHTHTSKTGEGFQRQLLVGTGAMGGRRPGGPSGMAARSPCPRPTRERARSVLAARRLYFCRPSPWRASPMTVHLGAGVDRVTALSARVRIELATLLGARTPRGQCCARVPEFVAHDAKPATAAGRRERPRAASSATTREPAKLHELGGAHFRPLRDSQDSARRRHAQGSARRHRTASSPASCRPASA